MGTVSDEGEVGEADEAGEEAAAVSSDAGGDAAAEEVGDGDEGAEAAHEGGSPSPSETVRSRIMPPSLPSDESDALRTIECLDAVGA